MRNWRAVIFDLDDTLYPERDFVLSGFRAAASWAHAHLEIEATEGYASLERLFEQGVRGNTFNLWLESYGKLSSESVRALVRVYREHQPQLRPFPDTIPVLASLHESYRLGLVSDGYLDVQLSKWAALGLAEYFEAVVFSDTLGRTAWKPSPLPFIGILKQLQVDAPSSGVYVADNPIKDFRGAREIGMYTVRILRPQGEYAGCTPASADDAPHTSISALDELPALLLRPLGNTPDTGMISYE